MKGGRQTGKIAMREMRRINQEMGAEVLTAFPKRALGLQRKIAADVYPNGAVLECDECGASQAISSEDTARYLATGWPKCCGHTMKFTPAPRA